MRPHRCQTCVHLGQPPQQEPCSVCSRTYSLRWEPVMVDDGVLEVL